MRTQGGVLLVVGEGDTLPHTDLILGDGRRGELELLSSEQPLCSATVHLKQSLQGNANNPLCIPGEPGS